MVLSVTGWGERVWPREVVGMEGKGRRRERGRVTTSKHAPNLRVLRLKKKDQLSSTSLMLTL